MTDKPDARVTMVWPKDLKEQVQGVAGPRGLTEFVIAAVQQHTKAAPGLDAVTLELNQTRALVQTMADKLVLGGDPQDRLQSLLDVEFPTWIETAGWPQAYADLVHARRDTQRIETTHPVSPEPVERQPAEAQSQEGVVYVDEAKIVRVGSDERRAARPQPKAEPQVEVPAEPAVASAEVVEPVATPARSMGVRNDLLAKVLSATGQDLPTPLKFASEISKPDPKDPRHNHSWERTDGILCCECGSWIDESDPAYPNGIVRDENWDPETSGAGGAPEPDAATSAGSEPSTPAPEPGPVMCPNGCGEGLIDGECWTCS